MTSPFDHAYTVPPTLPSGGLLALLLFQHSRREARTDRSGDVITLEEQDRSRWNGAEIDQANAILDAAVRRDAFGPTRRRLESPLATPTRRTPTRPTGPGSPPCTSGSSKSQRIRSSSSTTPSPSGWPPAPRKASRWFDQSGSLERAGRLPPPARNPRRLPAQAGPELRRRGRIPRSSQPGPDRRRASLPNQTPPRGQHRSSTSRGRRHIAATTSVTEHPCLLRRTSIQSEPRSSLQCARSASRAATLLSDLGEARCDALATRLALLRCSSVRTRGN